MLQLVRTIELEYVRLGLHIPILTVHSNHYLTPTARTMCEMLTSAAINSANAGRFLLGYKTLGTLESVFVMVHESFADSVASTDCPVRRLAKYELSFNFAVFV